MAEESDQPEPPEPTWREPLSAFAVVVVALIAASGLAMLWAPIGDHILAVAALVFLAVPFFILRNKGEDFERFGIDLESIPLREVGIGLLVTAAIFPLYAVGHHVWETQVEQRQFEPAIDNYRQWSVELEAPSLADDRSELFQIRTFADRLRIEWSNPADPDSGVFIKGDRSFGWDHTGGIEIGHGEEAQFDQPTAPLSDVESADSDVPSSRWYASPVAGGVDGQLALSERGQPDGKLLPRRLELDVTTPPQTNPPDIVVGTSRQDPDETIVLKRTHWWIVLWALTHLILVALPEEYFYRGYLQTRFGDLLGDGGDDGDRKTFLGFSRANWLTSAFFAVGHVLIPVGGAFSPARAAVFFPSLLFGWLRDRTGSIIAPTVFHAGANMMVLLLAVHYF